MTDKNKKTKILDPRLLMSRMTEGEKARMTEGEKAGMTDKNKKTKPWILDY